EPRAYLAEWDRGRRALTLTGSTQVPGIIRDLLADLLDMPGHRIRVIASQVGGGFGGKASLYPEEILCAVLARHLGRAVRWTGTRLEDIATTSHGFDEIVDAELGLDAEGRILALEAEAIGDVGAYSIYPWTAALEPVQVVSFLPGPYRVPVYRRLRHRAADRHGRREARPRSRRIAPPQPGDGSGISVPGRLGDRLGPLRLCRRPRHGLRGDRLRGLARGAEEGSGRGSALRHRRRQLCRADRDRLAHLGGARDADQHRHRDRDGAARLDRRRHRQLWHRLARSGAGDDAGAGDRRRARRAVRGYRDRPRRQRRGRARHRHLCEPQRGAR